MNGLDWSAGEEFRIITIGLDPNEGHRRAMESKLRYLGRYKRPEADAGWRFLTGSDASIHALAKAVGFGYKLHPTRGEYLHPAALMMVSPEGIVPHQLAGHLLCESGPKSSADINACQFCSLGFVLSSQF